MADQKIGEGAVSKFLRLGMAELQAASYFHDSTIAQQAQSMMAGTTTQQTNAEPSSQVELNPERERGQER